MKTLVITVIQPSHEDDGSAIRSMNFIRFLASMGTVDLIFNVNKNEDIANHPCRLFERIPDQTSSLIDKISYYIRHPFSFPAYIKNKYSLAAEKFIKSLILREDYDVIFVRYGDNVVYLRDLPLRIRRRIIVDLDDLYLEGLHIYFRVTTRYKLKRIVDKILLSNYEKACSREFGRMILCSEEDKSKYLARHKIISPDFISVVPNIIKPPENVSTKDHLNTEKPIMLFVGTLDYWVNREGLEWFINEIYDAYKIMFNGGVFWIVGKRAAMEFKDLISRDNTITLIEDAADLRTLYGMADFIVIPLIKGSGTRIKLLEAALYKRPIITTPMGSEGIEMSSGKEILQFSNKDDFKLAMQEIMQADTYTKLVSNAYSFVKNRYSVDEFNSSVSKVIEYLPDRK